MTICTGNAGLGDEADDGQFRVHVVKYPLGEKASAGAARRPRPCVDAGDAHLCLDQQVIRTRPVHALFEAAPPRALARGDAGDRQLIVEPRGAAVLDVHADHGEGEPAVAQHLGLGMPERAQPFRAGAFQELEVIGVVDDAAAVRVFPVHACPPGELAHRPSSKSGRLRGGPLRCLEPEMQIGACGSRCARARCA